MSGWLWMSKLVWITGLSGSGKTTIARLLRELLNDKKGRKAVLLDGDDFREAMGNDLGYSREDRLKNALRLSRFAKILISQDFDVICSTVSLFKEVHELNRHTFSSYFEVFIECGHDELIKRDQKGLYTKPKGAKSEVVGVSQDFDFPNDCHLVIDNTQRENLESNVKRILQLIQD